MEDIVTFNELINTYNNPMQISRLSNRHLLGNLGYGYYVNNPSVLHFDADDTIMKINKMLDCFPVPPERAIFSSISLNFCINQLISSTTYLVEVEKEYVQIVFEMLKAKFNNVVLLKPSNSDKLNYWMPNSIYVLELYSRSPTKKDGTVTIEKLVVDLLFDEDMSSLYSGSDVDQAIEILCSKYTINYKTLFAYASRRGKKEILYYKISKHIPEIIKEVICND